ncbi:MAG: hypothetical protein CXX80_03365 [Methanobacteriota archaeon]|nr:MAG: hypothetical protein CXX80_09460 [Euryarchaeota archaeon]PXY76170.1 MAG: hypothetical protein CXX80_03365 [Euryarchaeota archaeon]
MVERVRDEWHYGYDAGYRAGFDAGRDFDPNPISMERGVKVGKPKKKRPLSNWNKFVRANAKKPRFIFQSGKKKGKLNLKKMGVAYRKTPAGRKG